MTINRWFRVCIAYLILSSVAFSSGLAARPEVTWPASISLSLVKSGLTNPVHITHAGDDSGRLFVVEQDGRVRILLNGNLLNTPFLNITDRVRSPLTPFPHTGDSEEGLLSIAFPPGYGSGKEYFYVYYTNFDGNNQVSRFHLSANPNTADPGSEELIILFSHPINSNHNGGQLVFGPDGYLYIGTGDGGGGGDPDQNAQNPAKLLGKLLRIAVEPNISTPVDLPFKIYLPMAQGSSNQAYSIPADNPLIDLPGARQEIWALGLRNPWRFSFDRQTHDLYIGDVGQGTWEEIDFQPASSHGGENYGWNIMEGQACYSPSTGCSQAGLTLPIQVYGHNPECSVTGGYVYRGATFPALQGIYFYADYCSGKIWGLQRDNGSWVNHEFLNTGQNISSFGEDQSGELYLTTLGGSVYKIVTP